MVAIKFSGTKSIEGSNAVYSTHLVREMAGLIELEVFTTAPEFFENIGNIRIYGTCASGGAGPVSKLFNLVRHWFLTNHRYGKDDIVIALNPFEAVPFGKFRQILVIHDLIPMVFPKRYPFAHKYYSTVFARAVKVSSHIVAVSAHTKNDVIKYFGVPSSKVSVIWNGFGDTYVCQQSGMAGRELSTKIGSPFILYVGGQSYHKNILNLLRAYASLKGQFGHKLVLAGPFDPRMRKEHIEYCKSDSLGEKVMFLGRVSKEQLAWLYSNATLLVLPSLYEGFGLTPLEAMFNKIPVVASNGSSIPEVCGDAAEYVDPYDPADISRGISEVIHNEKLREQLINRGQERVKMFSWAKTAGEFLEVIENMNKVL